MNMFRSTRTPLASTILLTVLLGIAGIAPAFAQVNVPLWDFQGAWVKTTLYLAGGVVPYNGGLYELGFNINVTPISNANDCALGEFTSRGRRRRASAEITPEGIIIYT